MRMDGCQQSGGAGDCRRYSCARYRELSITCHLKHMGTLVYLFTLSVFVFTGGSPEKRVECWEKDHWRERTEGLVYAMATSPAASGFMKPSSSLSRSSAFAGPRLPPRGAPVLPPRPPREALRLSVVHFASPDCHNLPSPATTALSALAVLPVSPLAGTITVSAVTVSAVTVSAASTRCALTVTPADTACEVGAAAKTVKERAGTRSGLVLLCARRSNELDGDRLA